MPVIRLKTSNELGLLYFPPEPKSPHGCDVTPDGQFVVVGGKLDPHVTIYSTAKIRAAMKAPNAVTSPKGYRVERKGNRVEVWTPVIRSHLTPEHLQVKEGDHVVWHLTNLERARDATHGFCISGYNINLSHEPGECDTIEFTADQSGTFPWSRQAPGRLQDAQARRPH